MAKVIHPFGGSEAYGTAAGITYQRTRFGQVARPTSLTCRPRKSKRPPGARPGRWNSKGTQFGRKTWSHWDNIERECWRGWERAQARQKNERWRRISQAFFALHVMAIGANLKPPDDNWRGSDLPQVTIDRDQARGVVLLYTEHELPFDLKLILKEGAQWQLHSRDKNQVTTVASLEPEEANSGAWEDIAPDSPMYFRAQFFNTHTYLYTIVFEAVLWPNTKGYTTPWPPYEETP